METREKIRNLALSAGADVLESKKIEAYGTTFRGYGTVECNGCSMLCPLRFGIKQNKK